MFWKAEAYMKTTTVTGRAITLVFALCAVSSGASAVQSTQTAGRWWSGSDQAGSSEMSTTPASDPTCKSGTKACYASKGNNASQGILVDADIWPVESTEYSKGGGPALFLDEAEGDAPYPHHVLRSGGFFRTYLRPYPVVPALTIGVADQIARSSIGPSIEHHSPLDPVTDQSFWRVGGNAGLSGDAAVLGTSTPLSLILVVDGQPALRLIPSPLGPMAPNVIGGSWTNTADASASSATIGGGRFNTAGVSVLPQTDPA